MAAGSRLVVAGAVVQAPNDKRQVEPMLEKGTDVPDALGTAAILLADAGYFSAASRIIRPWTSGSRRSRQRQMIRAHAMIRQSPIPVPSRNWRRG